MNGVMVSVLCGRERTGWIAPQLANRLFEAISDGKRQGKPLSINLTIGASPVEKARNQSVLEFLQSPFSWLLQIDNDVTPPEHFINLITDAEAEGKFVFGAPCPWLDTSGVMWNVANRDEHDERRAAFFNHLPSGWHRCDFMGGAFLCVRRPVFEAIKSNWFDLMPNKSEDFSFCQRVRDAGFQPWFHGDYQCDHYHTTSLLEQLRGKQTAMTATA
jgi:hypothetical protein